MANQLQSMTGFGRGEAEDEAFRVIVEIKSVNNRYKDFRFRTPNLLNKYEMKMKETLASHCKRGTFDININFKKASTQSSVKDVDYGRIANFIDEFNSQIAKPKDLKVSVDPTNFLRNEFYMDLEDKEEDLSELTMKAFDQACLALKKSRESEGEKLYKIFEEHLANYQNHFSSISKDADKFNEVIQTRLKEKFEEFGKDLKIEEPRFMQEVIYYLEKMDIHEEINRIIAHLKKLSSILSEKSEVGREIDFLMQELNRETNTIGSKSSFIDISDNVVKMKVELEKLREQGLNLQ